MLYVFQNASYEEEVQSATGVLAEVNRILARNSPVHIIQRYFRGYLWRKNLGAIADTRTW